jgi:hypothetical protein
MGLKKVSQKYSVDSKRDIPSKSPIQLLARAPNPKSATTEF